MVAYMSERKIRNAPSKLRLSPCKFVIGKKEERIYKICDLKKVMDEFHFL